MNSWGEIHAQVMGKVQIEILQQMILERFGIEVEFGSGNIVYKETIKEPVEGIGHFEPLRHYAEVHLLLEPLERGAGLIFCRRLQRGCSGPKLAETDPLPIWRRNTIWESLPVRKLQT